MESKNGSDVVASSHNSLEASSLSSKSSRRKLQGPHACSFCGKVFPHVSSLRRHEVIHTNEKPHRCKMCSKAYTDPSSLRKHELVHSGEMPYKCAECSSTFRWAFSLKLHRRESSNIRCKACGSVFISQCAMKQHPCYADDGKANKSYIRTPYPCSFCGKHFNTASIVKRHERVHTGEKPYMCTTCGGQFADSSTLRNHQAVHTCKVPYKCEDCGKSFRWPHRFKAHRLIHAGVNPFLCTRCGVRVRTKKQLVKHCSLEHGYQITDSVLPTGVSSIGEDCETSDKIASSQINNKQASICVFCGKQFSSCYSARAHERIHTGEKPYSCIQCSKKFTDRSSLRSHLLRHSGVKPYKCNICPREFRQLSNLNVHRMNHFEPSSENGSECGENQQVTVKTEPLDLLISEEPTEGLDVDMELDCNSFLSLICEKEDFLNNSEVMTIQDVIEALPAVDNNNDAQLEVQLSLQLCWENLPFEFSTTDKLFSETLVVIERIDIPRVKSAVTKPLNVPASFKYSLDQGSHVCSFCSMRFRNDVTLRRHIPLHAGAKPYNCSVCQQAFRWSVSLKYHKQIVDEASKLLCKSCGQQFESQCLLRQHSCHIASAVVKQESENDDQPFILVYSSENTEQYVQGQTVSNPLQCRECGKMFRFVASRRKHEKLHSGEKPHMCTTCGKQFADSSTLRNHRRVHTGIKPLKCDQCGKSFLWPSRLESHKMLHAGINPHKCNNCGERFRFRKGLTDHKVTCVSQAADNSNTAVLIRQSDEMVMFESVVQEVLPPHTPVGNGDEALYKMPNNNAATFNKLLKCSYCEKRFIYDYELRKHQQMHTGEKPYRCDDCGKFYANSTCLRLHQRLHTGDRPHTCRQCGMQFRWLGALTSHLDMHSEVFPHACRSCGERFKSQRDLKEHRVQTHSSGKQDVNNGQRSLDNFSYRCPVCKKTFCNRHYLKKHILLHTSEMPYKCEDCGKMFRWQVSLKNHKVQHHDGVKPVVCKYCGQGFKSVYSLKKHCLIDHGSTKIFTCSFCPKYFLSSYAQARHEVIHQRKLVLNTNSD